jgi:hypothetical protein
MFFILTLNNSEPEGSRLREPIAQSLQSPLNSVTPESTCSAGLQPGTLLTSNIKLHLQRNSPSQTPPSKN